ncbi:MAG: hypothetical protein AB1756_02860 [Acidobacteriota bacterium]
MKSTIKTIFLIASFITAFLLASTSVLATLPIQKCMICHGRKDFKKVREDGQVIKLHVDQGGIIGSVHKNKICTDCHYDVVEIPHKDTPTKVRCTRCHFKGNLEGAPQSDAYLEYRRSVHGIESEKGNQKAPVCQHCHGDHAIRHTKDPDSLVFRERVGATCGKCHIEVYGQYINSIHGVAFHQRGAIEAPTCTGCHGEHLIQAKTDPDSPVFPVNVVKTCEHCHEEEAIVGKYGIEVEQVATYKESFHGIAVKFGSKVVANCASCHGVHDIRPSSDPQSSIYINNIPKTCGKCHPGANTNYARGKIHMDASKKEAGIIYYVASFFKYLTLLTMLGLVLHILLDFYRKSNILKKKEKEDRNS